MSSWTARHFAPAELIRTSRTAFRPSQIDGLADPVIFGRLLALATTILDPIRDHAGRPIRINSGYRSPPLNSATPGASKTSQHTRGEAADLALIGGTEADLWALWRWIGWSSGLPIGQVIYEDARPGAEGGAWIHVSLGLGYRAPERCGQRLTWSPATGYRTHTAAPSAPPWSSR
jgi:zinc D-Ala-D-Ala carboxypeptidase